MRNLGGPLSVRAQKTATYLIFLDLMDLIAVSQEIRSFVRQQVPARTI